ncbi:MAG: hypothetical protein RIQ64_568, partial [Actinomycetota bacterium]
MSDTTGFYELVVNGQRREVR